MAIRSFSSHFDNGPASRTIDSAAPLPMRQEFIDAMYFLFQRLPRGFTESRERGLYHVISQTLGIQPSGAPYGGFRYAISRDVSNASWERFYDLVIRIASEVPPIFQAEYRAFTNTLLAAYNIAWELRQDDLLYRVVPKVVEVSMEDAFKELSQPRFSAALTFFRSGMAAYNERPMRGRDACKNCFDALESVAKTLDNKPTGTFGDVLNTLRKSDFYAKETVASLQKLYDLANNNFRHGMTSEFTLRASEVDYVIVSCCAAMMLLIRA